MVEGAVFVRNILGCWVAPAGGAIWIPAGLRHSIEPQPSARVRTLYILRAPVKWPRRACRVIAASPLLVSLVDHLCRIEVLRDGTAENRRLGSVLVDQIGEQRELPLFIPALRSTLALRVAAALDSDPADTPRIRDLAVELGVSERTIERAFVNDVSMTIGELRQRTRIARAIALLAAGGDVKDVALEVGYATASAFVTAYKRIVGTTPGKLRR